MQEGRAPRESLDCQKRAGASRIGESGKFKRSSKGGDGGGGGDGGVEKVEVTQPVSSFTFAFIQFSRIAEKAMRNAHTARNSQLATLHMPHASLSTSKVR